MPEDSTDNKLILHKTVHEKKSDILLICVYVCINMIIVFVTS